MSSGDTGHAPANLAVQSNQHLLPRKDGCQTSTDNFDRFVHRSSYRPFHRSIHRSFLQYFNMILLYDLFFVFSKHWCLVLVLPIFASFALYYC